MLNASLDIGSQLSAFVVDLAGETLTCPKFNAVISRLHGNVCCDLLYVVDSDCVEALPLDVRESNLFSLCVHVAGAGRRCTGGSAVGMSLRGQCSSVASALAPSAANACRVTHGYALFLLLVPFLFSCLR